MCPVIPWSCFIAVRASSVEELPDQRRFILQVSVVVIQRQGAGRANRTRQYRRNLLQPLAGRHQLLDVDALSPGLAAERQLRQALGPASSRSKSRHSPADALQLMTGTDGAVRCW